MEGVVVRNLKRLVRMALGPFAESDSAVKNQLREVEEALDSNELEGILLQVQRIVPPGVQELYPRQASFLKELIACARNSNLGEVSDASWLAMTSDLHSAVSCD